jgi:uncharacterized protein YqjF (DUF2071 family)
MNSLEPCGHAETASDHSFLYSGISQAARRRILGVPREPLLYADWLRAVFIHFEVDPEALQRDCPFKLDLREGRAYASLVAFTMRGMRPRLGGQLSALLFKPIATHQFLNVRVYVKHHGEMGIHFLAEWLNNPVSVMLGPRAFGLPYRLGRLRCHHDLEEGTFQGRVTSPFRFRGCIEYRGKSDPFAKFQPSEAGSLDEFLLERYTAFNAIRLHSHSRCSKHDVLNHGLKRLFRIWHPPWPQIPIQISPLNTSLLSETWPWFAEARFIGANYSPGVRNVWMGRPQRILEA